MLRTIGTMIAILAFIGVCLSVTGCEQRETSAEIVEVGVVEQVSYVAGGTASGTGVGMSMSGNLVVTSNTMTIPDRWVVVFSCRHGKFSPKATSERAKQAFERLHVGDSVNITYREVYSLYNGGDGPKELIDLEFVDAHVRPKPRTRLPDDTTVKRYHYPVRPVPRVP